MTKGGKRIRAGRPKLPSNEKKSSSSIALTQDQRKKVDAHAAARDLSVSAFIASLIDSLPEKP